MGVEIDMTATGRPTNSSDQSSENLTQEDENLNRSVFDIAGINMQEENPIKSNRNLLNLENIDIQENKSIEPEGDAEMKEISPANERLEMLKSKLEILFEYEKRHLELLKEYKEEIKFANALQEDLRRERSNFFTQILGEVSESLKKAQVEPSVAAKWLQELVESYTKSLNLSVDLAKICVVEIIGKLREESEENLENIQKEKLENEDNSD